MIPTQNADGAWSPADEQISLLAGEYEAVWQQALSRIATPEMDSFLEQVGPDSQPQLREWLETINELYRRRLEEHEPAVTHRNMMDSTIIAPPAAEAQQIVIGSPAPAEAEPLQDGPDTATFISEALPAQSSDAETSGPEASADPETSPTISFRASPEIKVVA
ncbi:MAG: hypothetical protein ACREIV_05585, partial [Planctomycetaceae bacterium]